MSAIRVRTPGNNPETRIVCDGNGLSQGCRSLPIVDFDAREARRSAKGLDWVRVNGRDYCPEHHCPHGYVPGDHHYEAGTCGASTAAYPTPSRPHA